MQPAIFEEHKIRRVYAEVWPVAEFVQAVLAQLPWGHNLALLDRLNTPKEGLK
jgi:hypothetical protein